MKHSFSKGTINKSQKWSIKIKNDINKTIQLMNRLISNGWKLIEDVSFKGGYYTFKVEWQS